MSFKKYPYQDYNAFNLDWILETTKRAEEAVTNLDENSLEIITNLLTEWLNDGTLSDIFTTQVLSEISESTAKNAQQDVEIAANTKRSKAALGRKRCIAIGDSIAQGYTPDGMVTGWPEILRTKLNLSLNTNFFISARGGAGFVQAGQGKTFLNLLEDIASAVTEKETITDIYVVGGVNDALAGIPAATCETAVKTFCNYANTNYPNAKIHIGCIAMVRDGAHAFAISQVHNGYRKGCQRRAEIIPGIVGALCRYSNYASDGIHVKESTEYKITESILTGIGVHEAFNGAGTVNSAIVNNACMPYCSIDGDKLFYWMSTKYVNVADSSAVAADGTPFKVCDITETCMFGMAYNTTTGADNLHEIIFPAVIRQGGQSFIPGAAAFYPFNGSLYCKLWATSGQAYVTSNIVQFIVFGGAGSVPAI